MWRRSACLMALAVTGLPLEVAAYADETAPSILAASCVACHGTGGQSSGAIPSLAGIPADEMQTLLLSFRDGSTPATIMRRISKGYTDAEIAALAKEIAAWQD